MNKNCTKNFLSGSPGLTTQHESKDSFDKVSFKGMFATPAIDIDKYASLCCENLGNPLKRVIINTKNYGHKRQNDGKIHYANALKIGSNSILNHQDGDKALCVDDYLSLYDNSTIKGPIEVEKYITAGKNVTCDSLSANSAEFGDNVKIGILKCGADVKIGNNAKFQIFRSMGDTEVGNNSKFQIFRSIGDTKIGHTAEIYSMICKGKAEIGNNLKCNTLDIGEEALIGNNAKINNLIVGNNLSAGDSLLPKNIILKQNGHFKSIKKLESISVIESSHTKINRLLKFEKGISNLNKKIKVYLGGIENLAIQVPNSEKNVLNKFEFMMFKEAPETSKQVEKLMLNNELKALLKNKTLVKVPQKLIDKCIKIVRI